MNELHLTEDARFAASTDVIARRFGHESVVWPAQSDRPVYLDPIATLIRQMLDGTASIRELIDDIHDVIGIPSSLARVQVERAVTLLHRSGALHTDHSDGSPAWLPNIDYFPAPPST